MDARQVSSIRISSISHELSRLQGFFDYIYKMTVEAQQAIERLAV